MTPEIEQQLRVAFSDYAIDVTQYVLSPGSLEVREVVIPDAEDAPAELKGRPLVIASAVFDHKDKPLAIGIEWTQIKDTAAIFVGQMNFLSREVEVQSGEAAAVQKALEVADA
jgi:hypothetical protein